MPTKRLANAKPTPTRAPRRTAPSKPTRRVAVGSKAAGKRDAPPTPSVGVGVTQPECAVGACPIVGIGASAGGLEALQELFRALGSDTGMGYVVVQHLAPAHESLLSEILGRSTTMPVQQALEGTVVAPDHVYVIPPDREIAVESGKLRLGRRAPGRERFLPIDHFFRSLAEDCGGTSIGVVLSGTASDGVQGLRAIKAAGGITFAQDEQSAKHPEMPRSAVASGAVDLVMPPAAIARELARLRGHAFVLFPEASANELPREDARLVEVILQTLRTATGADFTYYKQSTIRRRILRRMAIARVERLEDYAKLVRESPAEVEGLYKDVLINVTSFFRDPATFKVFQSRVLRGLFRARQPGQRIRIWVPGCSTGEEVYSLAMCAFEVLGGRASAEHIQIFGTDLSEGVVDEARQGRYPESIAADVPAPLLARYFTKTGAGYQVAKVLRDACVFAKHNLLRDPPFSKIDVVSCRNVLIYFGSVLQRKALSLFHYALKPGGTLLLGSSEQVAAFGDLFTVVDKKHRLYSKNAIPSRLTFGAGGDVPRPVPFTEPAPHRNEAGALDIQREADRIVLTRVAPAGVVVDASFQIVQFRGQTGPFLASRPGAASLDVLKMAREGLVAELRGLLQRARKDGRTARRTGVRMQGGAGGLRAVDLEVIPFAPRPGGARLFLVLFEDVEVGKSATAGRKRSPRPQGKAPRGRSAEAELAATKEYLQTIIEEQEATNEELMSANEEILSSNEELQSTNEELETAKEELQSSNEELRTVNDELHERNAELHVLNDDLNHLLGTIHIPMVILDAELRLRRASPQGERLLNLIAGDVGRKVTDVRANVEIPDLAGIVREVIDTVTAKDLDVRDQQGHWYAMRVRPRKSSSQKIDGVVITWVDIDASRQDAQKSARGLAWMLLEGVPGPAAVLGPDLRLERGNAAWRQHFGSGPRDGPLTWGDEAFVGVLRGVLEGGRPAAGQRVDVPTAGASPRATSFSAVLVPTDPAGPVSLLLCVEPGTAVGRAAPA